MNCCSGAADTVTVLFDGSSSTQEVRFQFQAAKLGAGKFTFSATTEDDSSESDAVSVTVPVQGQQGRVQLASSFAVQGYSNASVWQEGLQLPDSLPGA